MKGDVTVSQYATRYLERVQRHQVSICQRTATNYARAFRLHLGPVLGDHPLATLTRADVREALVALLDRGVGRGAAWNAYIALSSVCESAVEDGLLQANPCHRATRKLFERRPIRVRSLARTALARFLVAVDVVAPTFRDLVYVLAFAGLRISEALGLMPEDVDVEGRRLRVARQWIEGGLDTTKNRRVRTIEISADLAELLERRIAATPGHRFIFQHPKRQTPWDSGTVRRVLRGVSQAAGLSRVSPHMLRHTAATLTLEETGDALYVSRMLGHASVAITCDLYGKGAQPTHGDTLEAITKALRPTRDPAAALLAKVRPQ